MNEKKFFKKETIVAMIIVTMIFVGFTLLEMPESKETVFMLTVLMVAVSIKIIVSLVVIIERGVPEVEFIQQKKHSKKMLEILLKGYWFDLLLINSYLFVIIVRLVIFGNYAAAFIFSIIFIFMITKTVVEYRREHL